MPKKKKSYIVKIEMLPSDYKKLMLEHAKDKFKTGTSKQEFLGNTLVASLNKEFFDRKVDKILETE